VILSPATIATIRRLEAEATSGRWASKLYHVRVVGPDGEPASGMRVGMWPHVASAAREEDSELIAELRNAAVALCDAAEEAGRMRGLLVQLRAWDMLSPGATSDGEYWRGRIDAVLATPAGET